MRSTINQTQIYIYFWQPHKFQEAELEKIDSLASLNDNRTYVSYNSTMKSLKLMCTSYLHILQEMHENCRIEEEIVSCLTSLDKHRLNNCKNEIETILNRIKINGELVDNQLLRIAMLHAYRHLKIIRLLCDDVRYNFKQTISIYIIKNQNFALFKSHNTAYLTYSSGCWMVIDHWLTLVFQPRVWCTRRNVRNEAKIAANLSINFLNVLLSSNPNLILQNQMANLKYSSGWVMLNLPILAGTLCHLVTFWMIKWLLIESTFFQDFLSMINLR